jgi:hypothetical protein
MSSVRPEVHTVALRGASRPLMSAVLPFRVPGVQGPPFPVPPWQPEASGWVAANPEVLERVRATLRRL